MPTLAVQLAIGDYAKWRPVFDKHKPLRDKAGLTNVRVYRDADNPTEVIVWGETSDVAKVRNPWEARRSEARCKRLVWLAPREFM